MLGSYLSPLAPAAALLLSAFILPIVIPGLPVHWRIHPGFRYYAAPGLVGLAMLTLLGIRLTLDANISEQGLELLSGWNFSTPESAAALMVQVDSTSLPFLIVTMLVLLAVTLLNSDSTPDQNDQTQVTGWLAMGAGACLLFVSANRLSLIFGAMAFDTFTALYWLGRGQRDWAVARLFLGIATASGIMMATLASANGLVPGLLLLGLTLWLRLGLYPLLEAAAQRHWYEDERLVYLILSLAAGIYLTIRVVNEPLPGLIRWLIGVTMVLCGLLAWLTDSAVANAQPEAAQPAEQENGTRAWLLTWLGLIEALIILTVGPLGADITAAYTVGLSLSLAALWVTPALGRPRLEEGAWSWPYLPAIAATITLLGAPLSLGWLARITIYQSLLMTGNEFFAGLIILAELLALSGLVRYWLILWQGSEINSRSSMVGIVIMVPLLIPAFGPFILATLTETDLAMTRLAPSSALIIILIVLAAGGFCLGYFRGQIMPILKIPTGAIAELAGLNWLMEGWQHLLSWLGRFVLRVRVILEGQHYIGWAVFVALIGTLIILLSG